jgi:hypothetical protein
MNGGGQPRFNRRVAIVVGRVGLRGVERFAILTIFGRDEITPNDPAQKE